MRIIKSNEVLTDSFGSKSSGSKSFKETLKTALDSVNNYQLEYNSLQNQNLFGDEVDLHNIVIAGEKLGFHWSSLCKFEIKRWKLIKKS